MLHGHLFAGGSSEGFRASQTRRCRFAFARLLQLRYVPELSAPGRNLPRSRRRLHRLPKRGGRAVTLKFGVQPLGCGAFAISDAWEYINALPAKAGTLSFFSLLSRGSMRRNVAMNNNI